MICTQLCELRGGQQYIFDSYIASLQSASCFFLDIYVTFKLLSLSLPQFVFVYQRGRMAGGDVALDDITIIPGSCYTEPSIDHSDNKGNCNFMNTSYYFFHRKLEENNFLYCGKMLFLCKK